MNRIFEYFSDLAYSFRRAIRNFRLPHLLTFEFWWDILTFPFRWFYENWQGQRFRNLLLGLPAVAILAVVGSILGQAHLQSKGTAGRYWQQAQAAMAQKDYPQAELLLTRILQEDTAHQGEARFALAVIYNDTGNVERAESLFRILAPEGQRGFKDAHRRLAIILADRISGTSTPREMERLRWHLNAANEEDTPEMALAWGRYAVATRNLVAARKHFLVAVRQFPDLWLTLGEIDLRFGDRTAAIGHFEKSSQHLAKRVTDNPEDYRARVDYAQVLMKLGRLDDARVVLEDGQKLKPDGEWSWLLASLAVNLHDVMKIQDADLSSLFTQLDKALEYEPNHGPALNRLMAYARTSSDDNSELRTILSRAIAEGKQPALAHLAMGNLAWIEGDRNKAAFHFERAISIRADMAVVLNNLAWLISHENAPDLPRALDLVNAALEQRKEFPEFLDTRGTIYLKQANWNKALEDLEKALIGSTDKKPIHEKLAEVYQKLGMIEISAEHLRLAGSAATNPDLPNPIE